MCERTSFFGKFPCLVVISNIKGKGKGKILPRTGQEGPEGEQMYSSTLPSTSALDWGGWSTPRPGRFTPRKDPVPIVQETGWAPGTVWTDAGSNLKHSCSLFALCLLRHF